MRRLSNGSASTTRTTTPSDGGRPRVVLDEAAPPVGGGLPQRLRGPLRDLLLQRGEEEAGDEHDGGEGEARHRTAPVALKARPIRAMATRPAAMRPRQRVSSTRAPAKPSSAGQERDRRRSRSRPRRPRRRWPGPDTNETFMTSMPISEMTTVVPANTTARPAVSIATAVASSIAGPVVDVLPVAGDDEERVVDADAEADHDADDRGEVGHREDVARAGRR